MSRFKSILYKILVLFLISLSFVDDLSYAVEKKYLIYQVKKHDTIYKILKKYKLLPVFGKGGYLKKTLDLNPAKKKTKGNLIYPRERLRIPLLIKGKKKKHSKKVVNREVEEVKFQAPIISTASIELKAYLDSIDVTLSWDVKDQQQPLTFEVKRSSFSGTEYKIIGQNIAEKEYIDKGLVFNNIYFDMKGLLELRRNYIRF